MKHWILGNGSIGCMHDSQSAYESKDDALEAVRFLYSDDLGRIPPGILGDLRRYGVHYVKDGGRWGMGIVELWQCDCGDIDSHNWY